MAGLVERLVETSNLNTARWAEIIKAGTPPRFSYNRRVDSVVMLFVPPETLVVAHYLDDHVALLYTPEDREVVGIRIESFERSFLPKYSELQQRWKLSDVCELENFGDLSIAAQKYETEKPVMARQISQITHSLVERRGLNLPIPA